jgi:tripartite-type tricarboxylate transporter receptor subunit TctC
MRKLLAALLLAPCFALAQSYPAKPVRLIVPFPPGGTTDLIARVVQAKFQEHLGQPVIIENKGGAGGSIGAAEAAKAAPDGYTLLMVFDTHGVNHHLYKQAPDPFKTLDHLMLMVTSPSTLVASADFPAANLAELVARAKAEPGKLTYGSTGTGSSNHLGALLLEQAAGIRMTHIPYKGGGPLVAAMLGKQVDMAFISTPLILSQIQAGKVKAIAGGGRQRMAVLPDLPTAAETYPGFEQISWFGLLTPVGVPKDITAKILLAMRRTLETPEVRKNLSERGFEVLASTPEEFLRYVQSESDKLGKLIRDNGIKVD